MKTVYILRLSQLTQSDIKRSVMDFAVTAKIDPIVIQMAAHAQGGSPLNQYPATKLDEVRQGAIYLFKTGQIDEEAFIARMNQAMGINLSRTDFVRCWNAMCTLQPATVALLREIEMLQKRHGFDLHVIGSTNSTHTNYIAEQFTTHGLQLNFSHTYSFEVNQLEPELPSTADPKWSDFDIVDLRDTAEILPRLDAAISSETKHKVRP
jgi:hypothetical protein